MKLINKIVDVIDKLDINKYLLDKEIDSDGKYEIKVTTTDKAENKNEKTYYFYYDTKIPEITANADVNGKKEELSQDNDNHIVIKNQLSEFWMIT